MFPHVKVLALKGVRRVLCPSSCTPKSPRMYTLSMFVRIPKGNDRMRIFVPFLIVPLGMSTVLMASSTHQPGGDVEEISLPFMEIAIEEDPRELVWSAR